jgi:hypothetical protein
MNVPPPTPAQSADAQQLKLIEIFHYVMSGLSVLGLLFLFMHYMIFYTVLNNPQVVEQMRRQAEAQKQTAVDPAVFFGAFKWFYLFFGLVIVLFLVLNLISGLCLRARKLRTFSIVVGGINCLFFPFGTALGVFTLIILLRPTMPALYHEPPR